jgi:8-oxo-dGTP diphosphatase
MITVVAAVIEEDGRFLVTRRPPGVHLAGLWEFPGGKTSGHESHVDALRREIREELAAEIDVRDLLLRVPHDYGDRALELFFYRCRLETTPQAILGQEMRWVAGAELPALGFPPADEALVRWLASGAPTPPPGPGDRRSPPR